MIKKNTAEKIIETMEAIRNCQKIINLLRGKKAKKAYTTVFHEDPDTDPIHIELSHNVALKTIEQNLELEKQKLLDLNLRAAEEVKR